MEPDIVSQLISGGIAAIPGGFLALVLIYFLRIQTGAVVKLATDFKNIVQENTKAMTENTVEMRNNRCRYDR